ncbi:PQQ-dependent sugar dehydrogenase [bacterium]|nr:PQQ-dependent sugar dehydrogenase [bacterium]
MTTTRLRAERLEDRVTPVTLPAGFTEAVFAAGLTAPTALAVTPTGQVFVAEQGGPLRVALNGTVLPTPFASLTVDSAGERGLIGVAVDPNYLSNGFVYVYYTVPGGGGAPHNRVSRFTANGDVAVPGSETVLLDLDPLSAATNHNGGALRFGTDGKLYVAVGDNANGANAQTLTNRLGKVLRINPDGSIPADNPTTIDGLGAVPAGPTRAIWAAGLRNPFTLAVDPASGKIIINDVGQNTFEEVNLGRAGANYGWPATEGDFNQTANPNFTRPLFAYAHNGPHPFDGSSVIGGAFAGSSFPADYAGDYFFSDLTGGWIDRLDAATGQVTNFVDAPTGQLVVGLDAIPGGPLLYLARNTGVGQGAIYQIIPPGASTVPVAVGAGAGGGPTAKLVQAGNGSAIQSVNAFGTFSGGVRVASADVTGDGVPDLIAGAGPGGGPDVRVFDGATGQQVRQFFAFEASFTGGVYVAAGDVNGDGFADIVVSPDQGGGPRVKVVSGKDTTVLADFLGIEDANFRGGARVAVGDVGGDGTPDVVVAAGTGGGPRVAVFDGATVRPGAAPARLFNDFFAFESTLRDGTFVAAGDVNGDGRGDIVVGAGPGGAPRVVAFDGTALPGTVQLASFFGGSGGLREGVSVAVRNVDSDPAAEIIVGQSRFSPPGVATYKVTAGGGVTLLGSFLAFDPNFTGGVFVG